MTDWIEAWLSAPRFAVYLTDAGSDRNLALARYDWNARMAAALHHDLGHLEVGLRNATIAPFPTEKPRCCSAAMKAARARTTRR